MYIHTQITTVHQNIYNYRFNGMAARLITTVLTLTMLRIT